MKLRGEVVGSAFLFFAMFSAFSIHARADELDWQVSDDPNSSPSRVVVPDYVKKQWSFLYKYIHESEFVICLRGEVKDGTVYIDDFNFPQLVEWGFTTIRYEPCDGPRYVGTAHNHPTGSSEEGKPGYCYWSIPDITSFGDDKKGAIDVILCREKEFVWAFKNGCRGDTRQLSCDPKNAPGNLDGLLKDRPLTPEWQIPANVPTQPDFPQEY